MTDVRQRLRGASAGESGSLLVDFVNERVGSRRAQRALAFMQGWGVAADELGRAPTVEEYARRFGVPIASAFRDQGTFRDAFPGESTPDRVLAVLWDEMARTGRRHLLSQPVRLELIGAEGASPVLGWFAATLLGRLPSGAARAVDRALPVLASSRAPRRVELGRAYRLADRAVFEWGAAVLGAQDPALRDALGSLERLGRGDPQPAAYAAALVREHSTRLDPGAFPALEAAARTADAVARLTHRYKQSDEEALVVAGQCAAETLVCSFAAAAVRDVVTPARVSVVELLEPT